MRIIVSSVVRATHKGEAHGGIYIVDFEDKIFEEVIRWDDQMINWAGRGGERGLRGIEIYNNKIYLANHNALFAYDKNFNRLGIYPNRYLHQCHEICQHNDLIWLTSTGWESIIAFDPKREDYVKGYRIEIDNRKNPKIWKTIEFDPNKDVEFKGRDSYHINNIVSIGGDLFMSGADVPILFRLENNRFEKYMGIPIITHNPMPYKDGVLLNYTREHCTVHIDKKNFIKRRFKIPQFKNEDILHVVNYNETTARQGFTRGLAVKDNYIVVGSSPAHVALFHYDSCEPLSTIIISKDIRNAVHGLEIYD
jgi:hypothetical protein